MLQVLTANRLIDGAVIYLAPNGAWVERLNEALVLETKGAAEAAVSAGAAAEQRQELVHAYLFEVLRVEGQLRPVRQREVIRAAGPSVRPDLGKQVAA